MNDIILRALYTEAKHAKYTLKSRIQDTVRGYSSGDPVVLAERLQMIIDEKLNYYYEVEEKIEERKRELGVTE